jgi:hypothetical protein
MKNSDTRVFSISDFLEWHKNGLLELDPDFQRRAVWSEKAKSYLVDTIVRGKPIPKIFISQRLEGARNVRIVVDGQQRLRAIIGFVNEDFTISRAHNQELAGVPFSELPQEVRDDFYQYEIAVDLLFNMTYEDTLDVFARLNSYTIILNKQERLNAQYLGYFKQAAFSLGHQFAKYFIEGGIMTKASVSRMAEAELASDLLMALLEGVQTNKNIELYYKKFEDDSNGIPAAYGKFEQIMRYISSIYPTEEIENTNWSRIHLFYTLFTSLSHLQFGISGLDPKLSKRFNQEHIGKIRVRLDQISATYDDVAANMEDNSKPAEYKRFITWSRRGTTDTSTRINRGNFVCEKLVEVI